MPRSAIPGSRIPATTCRTRRTITTPSTSRSARYSLSSVAVMNWRWASAALLAGLLLASPAGAQEDADEALHGPAAETDNYVAHSLLPVNDVWTGDLDGMQDRKRIRILVPFSKTFYFIDKGRQYGITYEIGTEFGVWLNSRIKSKKIKVKIVFIPVARDKLFSGLTEGLGDIAAGN